MKVTLEKQECTGTYKFNGQIIYTKGIEIEFGDDVLQVVFNTLIFIRTLVSQNIADYFQVAYAEKSNGEKVKFYIIDDIDHITFLLPDEY